MVFRFSRNRQFTMIVRTEMRHSLDKIQGTVVTVQSQTSPIHFCRSFNFLSFVAITRWLMFICHPNSGHNDPKTFEPCHEIMALFVLRKLILQMCMRSHPVGLDVCYLVGPFVCFNTSCVQTVKALVKLCGAQAHLSLHWSPMWKVP